MKTINLIAGALLLTSIAFPVSVIAGEGASTSYSLKKQNRVHFEKDMQEDASAYEGTQENVNPADIEPAAGAEEPAQGDATLAGDMKLPRKN